MKKTYMLEQPTGWYTPRLKGTTDVQMFYMGKKMGTITAQGAVHIFRGFESTSEDPGDRLHQFLYRWLDGLKKRDRLTRRLADQAFFERMTEDGIHPLKAYTRWLWWRVLGGIFRGWRKFVDDKKHVVLSDIQMIRKSK